MGQIWYPDKKAPKIMSRLIAIETFIKVVELSSFTLAAEALGMSRTMSSKHVSDLEAEIGTRLLNRTTRSISLTEAGTEFLERARAGLALLDEARAVAANLSVRPNGTLRLNAPMSFGVLHVAPAIAEFMKLYPDVKLDLTLNDRVVDLVDEGYDLAIRIGRLKDSSLVIRKLATCRIVLCASPDYLARRGTPQHPSHLADHAGLSYSYWSERGIWRFEKDGEVVEIKTASVLHSNNGDAIVAAAIGGAGIAMQPTFIAGDALRDGRLKCLLPQWSLPDMTISALFPPGRTPSLKARVFAEFMAKRLKPVPYWDRGL